MGTRVSAVQPGIPAAPRGQGWPRTDPIGSRPPSDGCAPAELRSYRSVPYAAMYRSDTSERKMRPVTKRSQVLELAVLGLLHESPMHGYELRKRLNMLLGTLRAFSYGSLYPCL